MPQSRASPSVSASCRSCESEMRHVARAGVKSHKVNGHFFDTRVKRESNRVQQTNRCTHQGTSRTLPKLPSHAGAAAHMFLFQPLLLLAGPFLSHSSVACHNQDEEGVIVPRCCCCDI